MPAFRARRHLTPIRPRLPRRALPWYAAAVGLTLLTAGTVHGSLTRAEAAEAAYGSTRPVAVAQRAIVAGQVIGAADVAVQQWPISLAPPAALPASPRGRVALVAHGAGDPITATRVSVAPGRGAAPLLSTDERALAVPVTIPGLELDVGDHVDLLAGGAPGAGVDGDLPGAGVEPAIVASAARVIAVAEETIVVALAATRAASVAAALTAGPLLVALRPPGR